ncbi:hypothetical protein M9458_051613, partial [Cirrhinus mrigala]
MSIHRADYCCAEVLGVDNGISQTEGSSMMYGPELCNVNEEFYTRQDYTPYTTDCDVEHFDPIHYGIDDEWNDGTLFDNDLNDDAEIQFKEKPGDCSLYKNAPVSTAESVLIILAFANRNKITGKALSDLVKLISLHCPVEHQT